MISFAASSCQAAVCFCEQAGEIAFFRQPLNTLSSLILVLAGLGIASTSRGAWPRRATGVAISIAGIASAAYHGTLLQSTQAGDVFGLLVIAATVAILELGWMFRWRTRTHILQWCIVVIVGMVSILLPAGIRQPILASIFAVGVLAAIPRVWGSGRRVAWNLSGAAIVLLLGLLMWSLDESYVHCAAHGHAIWHVAGAISAWLYASTWPRVANGSVRR